MVRLVRDRIMGPGIMGLLCWIRFVGLILRWFVVREWSWRFGGVGGGVWGVERRIGWCWCRWVLCTSLRAIRWVCERTLAAVPVVVVVDVAGEL